MITEKQIDARMEVIMQSRSHNILFHDGTAETYDAAFIVRATSMLTDEQFEDCIHYLHMFFVKQHDKHELLQSEGESTQVN